MITEFNNKVTAKQYLSLQEAFTYFNQRLFGNGLPECLITFQRKKGCGGYFSAERFESRVDNSIRVSEIALNCANFSTRDDKHILSILVHEMCHHWQYENGTAPKTAYHNKEFAAKMLEVGLQCSDTGAIGGNDVGNSMSHYILENAKFDTACTILLAKGLILDYNSRENKPKRKSQSKFKYTCPECDSNVWGKKGLNIKCDDCEVHYLPA